MGKQFNTQQAYAIESKNNQILVAAAAGSGKTTVLIERIIQKMLDPINPIHIDELIVLTFTEAAAEEMKQRLYVELNRIYQESPSTHIEEQFMRLEDAHISTFHGFCSKMIRKYYFCLNHVAPDYQIADTIQMDSLKEKILTKVIDDYCSQSDFIEFVNAFYQGNDKTKIKQLILKLYQMESSVGDINAWYQRILQPLEESIVDLKSWSLWQQNVQPTINKMIKRMQHVLLQMNEMADIHQLDVYLEKVSPLDNEILDNIIKYNDLSYSQMFVYLSEIKFKILSLGKDVDEDIKADFSDLRQQFKDLINKMKSDYFVYTQDEHLMHLNLNKEHILLLKSIVKTFKEQFKLAKQKEDLLDFNDLEDYMIELLSSHADVRQEISNSIREIMVDEYQDTNGVQEYIIQMIIQDSDPKVSFFMVGDIKQSIYAFRLAEPKLFREKYQLFNKVEDYSKPSNDKCIRIDLKYNYRSRKQVLESINLIFDQIMDIHFGSIEYYNDKDARLNYGFTTHQDHLMLEEDKANGYISELRILDTEEDKTFYVNSVKVQTQLLSKAELEAHLIAQRIIAEVNQNKELKYSDIVILSRSTTQFTVFKQIFDLYKIPNFIDVKNGFFEQIEIKTVLAVLDAIINQSETSFIGFLRAPFIQTNYSETELSQIAISSKSKSFYKRFVEYATEDYLGDKIKRTIEFYSELKYLIRQLPVLDFINHLLEITDFQTYVLQLDTPIQRFMNIELLKERLSSYQNKGFQVFTSDMLNLLKTDKDLSNASIIDSNDNVVKMMTIHRSKGLEFPVVILSSVHRPFNLADLRGDMLIHKDIGLAFKYVCQSNLVTGARLKYTTLYQSLLSNTYKNELIEEEMRLLYVALTRAKTKFIMTGVKEDKNLYTRILNQNEVILPTYLRDFKSYYDMIIHSIIRLNNHPHLYFQTHYSLMKYEVVKATDFIDINNEEKISQEKIVNYEGIHYNVDMIRKNASAITKQKAIDYSLFNQEGASYGTLMHEFLEYLPIKRYDETKLENELRSFVQLTKQKEAFQLSLDAVLKWTQSELYQLLLDAKICYKEYAFTSTKNQQVIHGIIDLLFVDDKNVYIVDYKTDRVESKENLKEKYRFQIENYMESMKSIFPDKQIKGYVYFISINEYIYYKEKNNEI